jgi:hypothetical protein
MPLRGFARPVFAALLFITCESRISYLLQKYKKKVCTAIVQSIFFYFFRQDLKVFRRNLKSEHEIQANFDDIQTSPFHLPVVGEASPTTEPVCRDKMNSEYDF